MALALASAPALASPEAPNFLFFGNSFTMSYFPTPLPALVGQIHSAAERPVGTIFQRATSGYSFQAHLEATGLNAVDYLATQTLPAGETWDYVVLQGNSTESTAAFGNPAAFVANGKTIFNTIKASNPNARAILFETWARSPQFVEYYPIPFESPQVMQDEIRTNYRHIVNDLNIEHGAGTARFAPVGDAFAALGFPDAIYGNDFYHSNNRGELMIALTIYGTLYGPTATELAQTGVLDALATSLYLPTDVVLPLAMAADAVGVPEGDADMDWDVDFDDLLTLAQHYGQIDGETGSTSWFTGDFNASGTVDFDDLLSLAQHYGQGTGTDTPPPELADVASDAFIADFKLAQSMVPEPASLAVLSIAGLALVRRRS